MNLKKKNNDKTKVKKVNKNFFYLPKNKIFVEGINKSLILDLREGEIYHINTSGKKIIALGEKGFTIEKTIDFLKSDLDSSVIVKFIDTLTNQGLITQSTKPKITTNYKKHHPKIDTLWIEVTPRCNLKCIHCYANASGYKDPELAKDVLFTVINDAADEGCQWIQLTGGEPTIRPDLLEIIKHAKHSGINDIEVFTNGTLLTEKMIREFSDLGITVAISIYSHKQDIHDEITQSKGSHQKTINNLKLLLEHGITVRCGIIAMKQNELELEDTINFLSKLGAITSTPDPIRPAGRGISNTYWPTQEKLLKIRTEPDFSFNETTFIKNLYWNECWFGKAAVSSSGDVLPCVFARNQIVGNVKHERLKDILKSKKMLELWGLNKDKVKICRNCEYRYICQDCRPWAYGFSGDLYSKSPRCSYNPIKGIWDSPLLFNKCNSFCKNIK